MLSGLGLLAWVRMIDASTLLFGIVLRARAFRLRAHGQRAPSTRAPV